MFGGGPGAGLTGENARNFWEGRQQAYAQQERLRLAAAQRRQAILKSRKNTRNGVMSGENVERVYQWANNVEKPITLRQYFNDVIHNPITNKSVKNNVIVDKKRLLEKGAKPKTTRLTVGLKPTLYYPENAEYVKWNTWGSTIADPRQSKKGGKKTRRNRR